MAMKWLFYARDARGGLGERRLFLACMVPLAKEFPEYVAPVVALVPEYGRWDDLWCLLDTPVCDCVTGLVKEQLYDDAQNAAEGKPIFSFGKVDAPLQDFFQANSALCPDFAEGCRHD